MDELCKMTAGQVVSLLKAKEITPLELIGIAEQRIDEVDGTVNAMPTVCFDRAREHARQIMDHPPADPPDHYLYGLPIGLQMVAASQREDLLLGTAALFEDLVGLQRQVPIDPRTPRCA